jgi:ubiquinone/menaquinone biosynthesis C-methylase UbiE
MDQKIWDNLAVDYDKSVENNENSLIVNYLKREIDILATLCESMCRLNNNCSIIDMGAGTGRVVFALDKKLHNTNVQFYGVEISEPMLNYAHKKNLNHERFSKIDFIKSDLTNSNLYKYFNLNETNIVICSYNTLGVIPFDKRQKFVDNMKTIAGEKGLVILTTFNGDNFSFVAPKLYNSMMPMIRQIDDDSFDEKNRLFQNSLGFHSQWFTKNELKSMLNSDVEPISIDVTINDVSYTFGNVFVDRAI